MYTNVLLQPMSVRSPACGGVAVVTTPKLRWQEVVGAATQLHFGLSRAGAHVGLEGDGG